MKTAIIFDTETTDLVKPILSPLYIQPYITEIYCLKINMKTLKPISDFQSYFKVPVSIPPYITRLTGIDDRTLENEKPFSKKAKKLKKFFHGVDTVIGHNLSFDLSLLYFEIIRNKIKDFPIPKNKFCTIEQSMYINGFRMKLVELYEHFTGETEYGAHEAENDVLTTFECYKGLIKQIENPKNKKA